MGVLLDPQVLAAAITVAMTVLAAALGYFLREWLARVKPFIAVVSIDGDVRRAATYIEVPEAILSPIQGAPIISSLSEKAALPDIEEVLEQASGVIKHAPIFLDMVKQFRKAADSSDSGIAQSVIGGMLGNYRVDHWLTLLLGEKHVVPIAHDPSLPILVPCTFEQNHRNGSYMIGLTGDGSVYGKSLNQFGLYRQNSLEFIGLIERLELKKLAVFFEASAIKISELLSICKDVAPLLQGIVDRNSQWTVGLFLANLGKTPLLLQRDAKLLISDKNSGGTYQIDLSLIILKKNKEGRDERYEARSPLVVRSESDVTFEFATRETQEEMKNGDAIRLLFKSGAGVCEVAFSAERAGPWRFQAISSPSVTFEDA